MLEHEPSVPGHEPSVPKHEPSVLEHEPPVPEHKPSVLERFTLKFDEAGRGKRVYFCLRWESSTNLKRALGGDLLGHHPLGRR